MTTDSNNELEEISRKAKEFGEKLFEEMSVFEPLRTDVKMPDDDITKDSSIKKRAQVAPKETEMQTADRRLNPELVLNNTHIDWLERTPMARIMPQTYEPYRKLITKHLIRSYEINPTEAFITSDTFLSIGIDGMGRLDELGVVGAIKQNQLEEKSRLGLA